jgi:acyl transferase domain-containing protein/acyl carrier protein
MSNNTPIAPTREPIAIIGIGCRFPGGAHNPEQFWNVLAEGVDGIIDVPADRWDFRKFYDADKERIGKSHAKQAGFLQTRVDAFDPLFFGISPREAAVLDPQQRLLLELTWEAFEDAGLIEERLKGSNTGVFIGGFTLDNKLIQLGQLNREIMSSNTATSSTMVMLSNRISYTFDLRGPSVSMDTACSSSLVAAHYACQSIWSGESDLAITGGVSMMLTPEYPITMSKGQFLSDHSRCKAFDEDARGYVRGEGGGIIILKPLSKAIADNDSIYAVVRATGANQDGATNGITVPNPVSQAALVRKVYAQAGVSASELGYVEAHGTGTKAGDPVEATALNEALSEGRSADDKCFVGSVKTNIGHLEAGAGVAGLIKATLSVNKRKVLPNLHFHNANPKINFDELCLKVPTQVEEWPAGKERAFASVNSFGYGGTNGHALVEGYEQKRLEFAPDKLLLEDATRLYPFSARSEEALKQMALRYAETLEDGNVNIHDFHYSLAQRRSALHSRLAVTASSLEELKDKLKSWADGGFLPGLVNGTAQEDVKGKLVFVYTGMGPQWWAMGHELLKSEPVFRNKVKECDAIFRTISGWSIMEEMLKPEAENRMARTEVAQPANFVIQAGLTALWNHWGIFADAVVGHSVGEVAAAYASGALSLEDALLVSYHRSRIQQTTAGQGTMLAIGLGEEDALTRLNNNPKISVAAINSFNAVTLAGEEAALLAFGAELTKENIFNKMLKVEVAYHSYQMEPLKNELFTNLASVKANVPTIPLYSTVTGERVLGADFGTEYWWMNVRQPVRFAKAITSIIADGYTNFVEVGPHPVTKTSINECLSAAQTQGNAISSLKRGEPEMPILMDALSQLFIIGYTPNWNVLAPKANFIKLPSYPWQKEVYWNETDRSREYRLGTPGHVFLNDNLRLPDPSWEVEINHHFLPWLEDHQVENKVVIPGAAYVEAGLALHEKEFGDAACTLQELRFNQVLVADPSKVQMLHTTYNRDTKIYQVYSREKGDTAGWQLHATGRMLEDTVQRTAPKVDVAALKKGFANQVAPADLYTTLTGMGLHYGPYFQGLKEIFINQDEVLCRIQGHENLEGNTDQYILHPSILDSAFQSMVALVADPRNTTPFVPVSIDRFVLYKSPGNAVWCHGTITDRTGVTIKGDLVFFNENGEVMAKLTDLTCRAISNKAAEEETVKAEWFYEPQWDAAEAPVSEEKASDILLISEKWDASTEALQKSLFDAGATVYAVSQGEKFVHSGNGWVMDFQSKDDFAKLTDEVLSRNVTQLVYVSNGKDKPTVETVLDTTMPAVLLANALSDKARDRNFNLSLVSFNAQAITGDEKVTDLGSNALWGFAQLISNEYPWINTRLFDIASGEKQLSGWAYEVLGNAKDSEVAYRDGQRYLKQLVRAHVVDESAEKPKVAISADESVELMFGNSGRIEDLHHIRTEKRAPKADEIQLRVHSSSINFKDLLKVLGQISQDVLDGTFFGNAFGMECSGVVTAVGSAVTEHKVGDEVVVATPDGCFSSYVTVKPTYWVKKPSTLKFEEAPVMIPYMTTIHGLVNVAQIKPGDKVLIHNAAGAVGQAAIQVARWKGAEVFATAGTEEKREFLRKQGVKYIFNSRDLSFTEDILTITKGYGVDVVLNAIAGEGLYQSFRLLAPYGRFIEIGKRDIAQNTALPMSVFNRNITFAHIDIDRILRERYDLSRSLLDTIYQGFEEGFFQAMPVKVFKADEAIDAYDYVRRSQHTGKVVISYSNCTVDVDEVIMHTTINPEGTYLITGGTAGFGLEIAKWLGEKQVKQLVLLSRSGIKSDEAKAAVATMETNGTKVFAPATDMTDAAQVASIIAKVKAEMPQLRGVFHGAMVLDDGFLNTMDRTRFDRVLQPKVKGALNLHAATEGITLDFFLSFSSISSVIGNAGQANYVAANSFLDGFAHWRRSQGLAATTVNLGVLAQVGVVARNSDVGHLLEGAGIKGFSTAMALESLELIIESGKPQVGLFDINWRKWAAGNPTGASRSLFRTMIDSQPVDNAISEKVQQFLGELAVLDQAGRQQYIEQIVAGEIAQVLRIPIENIDMNRGINFLGIDSLMAVELERGINGRTGVEISTMELLSGPTVPQLANVITNKLPSLDNIVSLESELDNMTEEELDALLSAVS